MNKQYGVSFDDLVHAAPWMFTLLAEMSLADRRRRLEGASAAFEEAMRRLPDHLGHGRTAAADFEHAYHDERESLAARDVFGRKLLETDHMADPFDPDLTNPFVDFLMRLAADLGSDEVHTDYLEAPYGGVMPHWPVFQTWLHKLTGDDRWARFSVEHCKIDLDRMPAELNSEDRTADRIAWLVSHIPAEVREREEKRRAEVSATFHDLGIVL